MGFSTETQEGLAFQQGEQMKKSMTINLLLALTALGIFASCAPANKSSLASDASKQSKIIGGVVSTEEFQKQNGIVGLIMVFTDENGNQNGALCTGSMIKPNIVLTAAHCLELPPKSKLNAAIVFFSTDFHAVMKEIGAGDKTHARAIVKVQRNEQYLKGKGSDNDVGLIRFAGDVPAGFQVANMPTAQVAAALHAGATVTLSGYGVDKYVMGTNGTTKTSEPIGTGDGILRQVSGIKLLALSQDQNEMQFDQSTGAGACHGDSGGPAYLVDSNKKAYLVGVTSRGEGLCNQSSVYSSVFGYSKWIDSTIQKLMQ